MKCQTEDKYQHNNENKKRKCPEYLTNLDKQHATHLFTYKQIHFERQINENDAMYLGLF